MKPELALLLTLLISLAPALLFLGFFKGMRRMQSSRFISTMNNRMEDDLNEVSLSDAARSVFDGDSVLPETSPERRAKRDIEGCHICGANNTEMASYCHKCTSKL